MSPYRWILSSVRPQHIYSRLLVCTLVPWFPFSLSVGDLTSVNGIHQWPVIRWWTTMFDLGTSIHIVGHVLVAVYVEDLPDWWHLLYSTSLIMPVFMRFQLSWLDSNICQTFPAIMEILIHCTSSSTLEIMIYCILYMAMTTHVTFCISCLFMAIVLSCIWDCYMYLQSCKDWLLYYTDGWLVLPLGSSSLHFWDGFIMYFGQHVTHPTSHIRGHLLHWLYHTWLITLLCPCMSLYRLFGPHVPWLYLWCFQDHP